MEGTELWLFVALICLLLLLYMVLHYIYHRMDNPSTTQKSNPSNTKSLQSMNIWTVSKLDSVENLTGLPTYEKASGQQNYQSEEISTLPSYEEAIEIRFVKFPN